MRALLQKLSIGAGLALLASAALAAPPVEEVDRVIFRVVMYGFLVFVIVAVVFAYFMKIRDKRAVPLKTVFEGHERVHSVRPDTLVIDCVRTMAAERIGAVTVMDGGRLAGIFTERDALNKVLAAGRDPGATKVAEVMTKDPYTVPPATTVGAAMEVITRRRFRHLPIVDGGKVLAVVSSGDLTHWLVKDQVGEVQELVELAAKS